MSKLTKALTAAAGNAGGGALYAEDVFSTYLYNGSSSGQSVVVNNGIDLSGEGGMTWLKWRNASQSYEGWHVLYDTERGVNKRISSNDTQDQTANSAGYGVDSFNTNGFTIGPTDSYANQDPSARFVSWTFRKAEKFFDVVTYTGNGTAGRTVAHNLGSVPAVMIVKSTTNGAYGWRVYHQSLGNTDYLRLDETNAAAATAGMWNNTTPTDSEFTLGGASVTNGNGESFVAYLFASDAGGFGDDGDENIIKCGSYTGNATKGLQVNCGFEPQLIITKRADASGHGWMMYDTMRGFVSLDDSRGGGKQLLANSSNAEAEDQRYAPTSTGFELKSTGASVNANGGNYIYIAIRRPMKTPESGTEVFAPLAYTGNSTADRILTSSNNPVDLGIVKQTVQGGDWIWTDRLRGAERTIYSNYAQAEGAQGTYISGLDVQSGIEIGSGNAVNNNTKTYISYMLSRATGFMDVVCYTGNGASSHALTHNLGVSPELIITKRRDAVGIWRTATNFSASAYSLYALEEVDPAANINYAAYGMYAAKPTSTTFTVGSGANVNASGGTFVSYLFGTVAGVSKVGSVVHSGTTNVDCGFSAGARFVLAKRADQNSDWFVWDSASGIVAGNDPYVRFNTSDPYVTSSDFIDPLSSGFTLTSSFTAGTYIFLAIA